MACACARKKMKGKEVRKNEWKVTVKKEKGSIYRQNGERFWPQDSDLTVAGMIPRLHVARKSLCGYHARSPLRARF